MPNELLTFDTNQVQVSPGTVTFEGYETLKQQAQELANEIKQVQVTDENIKENKKMLAAVNKRVKELSDRRVLIKKQIMEPYNAFEEQVKQITDTVKEADTLVRNQVKELEEQERQQKENQIREIFDKRICQYPFKNIFTFDDFITPKHLNKSTSLKSVEEQMVDWLEKIDSDFQVIQGLDNKHDVLMEYKDTKDLGVAMNNIKQHEEHKQQLEDAVPKKASKQQQFVITLTDEKDLKMVEMFMEQNQINYTKVVK